MNWLEEIQTFVSNGGRYRRGEDPVWGEPYYDLVMRKHICEKYSSGDRVDLIVQRADDVRERHYKAATLLLMEEKRLVFLSKGKSEWKNKGNIEYRLYDDIKDISLIEKAPDDFDVHDVMLPEEFLWREPRKQLTIDDGFGVERVYDLYSRKKREKSRDVFEKLYPEHDFEDDMILEIKARLYLHRPIEKTVLSVKIFVNIPGQDMICLDHLYLSVPYANKNPVYACNYDIDGEGAVMVRVPKGCYKDVTLSCVWKLQYKDKDGKQNEQRIVSVAHIRKLEMGEESNENCFSLMISSISLDVFRDALHTPSSVPFLKDLMNAEACMRINPSEHTCFLLRQSSSCDLKERMGSVAHAFCNQRRQMINVSSDGKRMEKCKNPVDVWVVEYEPTAACAPGWGKDSAGPKKYRWGQNPKGEKRKKA